MSGVIQVIPGIEFFLILVILIIASFGLQTWLRRKDISFENKKFVKQFVISAITILLSFQVLFLVVYCLLK
ncbi:MAG: hypothetical protein C0410_06955 [Anaerolinea sp.]|nr:hypothetical protein [Anaerolinea sp.]